MRTRIVTRYDIVTSKLCLALLIWVQDIDIITEKKDGAPPSTKPQYVLRPAQSAQC